MKYLIIGALITTIAQFVIITTGLNLAVNNKIIQIIVMMVFAYIISLCSTADAFIGRAFINQVSNSSILAFLILGPMIDLKNTLVLEALSYGGQIINTLDIENYPTAEHISGFDFATKLFDQAKKLGTEIKFEGE